MAREVVLSRIATKTVYSQNGDVAKDHSLPNTNTFVHVLQRVDN